MTGHDHESAGQAAATAGFRRTMPTRQARAKAAAITAVVAILAAILTGMAESLVFLVAGVYSFPGADFTTADITRGLNAYAVAPWMSNLAGVLVYAVAALTAARLGRSTVGDPVMAITAVTRTGARAGRGRVLLNTALPIAVWAAAQPLLGTWGALVVTAVLWAPALVRDDRRSVYSLITGTCYETLTSDRDTPRDWAKIPRSQPRGIDPSNPVA